MQTQPQPNKKDEKIWKAKWEHLVELAEDLDIGSLAKDNKNVDMICILAKIEQMERRMDQLIDVVVELAKRNETTIKTLKEAILSDDSDDSEETEEEDKKEKKEIKGAVDRKPAEPSEEDIPDSVEADKKERINDDNIVTMYI